mmetsp:Transcript_22620/g.77300  ORF Transcript_22620/g.77300 Transcript_22620/m.77300 type:complete len:954 (-) Transcript_22620:82-2943(-)
MADDSQVGQRFLSSLWATTTGVFGPGLGTQSLGKSQPKGLYGGVADADFKGALRTQRQLDAQKAQIRGLGSQETIPIEAYSTLCPLEYLCGIPPEALPGGDLPLVQATFGNAADAATQTNRKKDQVSDVPVTIGTNLGLSRWSEQGLDPQQEPRALRQLKEKEEKEHFLLACEVLGLQYVHKQGNEVDNILLTLPKDDVPGSLMEVKDRIKRLLAIEHVNVLRLQEACEDDENIYFIYEANEGWGYLPLRVITRMQPLSGIEAAKLGQQVAAATAACHRHNIFHLDWSVWNLVSSSYGNLFPMKVFGFGLAGVLHSGRSANLDEDVWKMKGPFFYMSPDIARVRLDDAVLHPLKKVEKPSYGPADIWGLGVCIFVGISGHYPFGGADGKVICTSIVEKQLAFDTAFKDIDPPGIELLERMLEKDYRRRPRATDIICNGWVVTNVRAIEDREHVHLVVQRMKEYSTLKPGMRTLALVLKQSLRIDKLKALQGLFHALDIRGDGELEPHELGAYFVNKNQELKELFKLLDLNNNGGISLDEFVNTNVFGREVLTERMLLRTFEYLDLDGTGEITAFEFYSALKKVDATLTPEHVGELMGDADRDWDADIDFDEFRTFFPNVMSSSAAIEERQRKATLMQELLGETFGRFRDDCVQWRSDINDQQAKAKKARLMAERDDKGQKSEAWTKEMLAIIKTSKKYVRNPPKPLLPSTPFAATVQLEEEERKRQLLKFKKKPPSSQGVQEEDHFENEPGGALFLDSFFRHFRESWSIQLGKVTATGKFAAGTRNKQRKRQDVVGVFDDLEELLKECYTECEIYVDEQWDAIDAAKPEGGLPKPSLGRRGLVVTEIDSDDAAVMEIERFKKERKKIIDQESRLEESRLETRRLLLKTELGGELRGYEWMEKAVARAEKKGKAPPAAARTLKALTVQVGRDLMKDAEEGREEQRDGEEDDDVP